MTGTWKAKIGARYGIVFAVVVWLAVWSAWCWAGEPVRVVIDYFYEAGCADCERVKNQVMPELVERFEGFYVLAGHDVGVKSNVMLLAAYQSALGIATNKPVMMVVDCRYVLNGFEAIKAGLLSRVDECIAERQEPDWKPPVPPIPAGGLSEDVVHDRVKGFALPMVMIAGLLDGLNPCAIASLVFLMSMLAVARVRGRGLLVLGAAFCVASFVAYTALGFGLLRVLHLFSGFPFLRKSVDLGMIVLLVFLAVISFRDARRFGISRDPADVALQLPGWVKERIHGVIRVLAGRRRGGGDVGGGGFSGLNEGTGAGVLVVGGVVTGFLVTVLESVCTGQMYVPTLVVVVKSGKSSFVAAWYLLLYNLMFILPLVVVFVLTYFGLRTGALLEWSRRNVVVSKMLLGCFFLVLAVLVWLL